MTAVAPTEAELRAERDRIGHHIGAEYERLAEIRGQLAALQEVPKDG